MNNEVKRFINESSNYDVIDYINNLQQIEKEHQKLNGELRKENQRLNNIINELEKWLDKKEKLTFNSWNKGIHEVQRKLQELKENNKDV